MHGMPCSWCICPLLDDASCVAFKTRPPIYALPFMVARSRRLEDRVDLKELAPSPRLYAWDGHLPLMSRTF